jgi:ribosome-binding protein aMBF1 (putative translation factor)
MSIITICDECGKVDDAQHQGDVWYHICGSRMDLCPDCYRKNVRHSAEGTRYKQPHRSNSAEEPNTNNTENQSKTYMDRSDPMAENESTADTIEVEALYRRDEQ